LAAALWQQVTDELRAQLTACNKPKVLLALSGGLDSMVLLELLSILASQLPVQLSVAHVCHQLQKQAPDWLAFCAQQCLKRQLPFHPLTVQLAEPTRNIEQQARTLRYQALASLMDSDTVLLTAHHADDQLETILLALKRGAGLTGLAGIAQQQSFAQGLLVRPLLAYSRQQLELLASWRALAYVQDPSNQDVSFDRNFLRQQVLPLLTARFATMSQTASRSASHLQQSLLYQTQQLEGQLAQLQPSCGLLDLRLLAKQPQPAQDLLLRQHLASFALNPSQQQLRQISQMFLHSRLDAQPQFVLSGMVLRRYEAVLYIEPSAVAPKLSNLSIASTVTMAIPELALEICWQQQPLAGWQQVPLAVSTDNAELWLSFGSLNRRFRPAEASFSKAIKDWCKIWKVPPWRRGILPLIIAGRQNSEVVAVLATRPIAQISACQAIDAQSWLNWRQAVTTSVTAAPTAPLDTPAVD